MVDTKKSREYNAEYRRALVPKIEALASNKQKEIFDIIVNEIGDNYTSNRNGIFININMLSDGLIKEILVMINR